MKEHLAHHRTVLHISIHLHKFHAVESIYIWDQVAEYPKTSPSWNYLPLFLAKFTNPLDQFADPEWKKNPDQPVSIEP